MNLKTVIPNPCEKCNYGKEQFCSRLCDSRANLFKVSGGLGAFGDTIGSSIFGEFIIDGEKCRQEGYDVERFATEDEIKEATK